MNAPILTKLLVSYRENSSYERLRELIVGADDELPELLAADSDNQIDLLQGVARDISSFDWRAAQRDNTEYGRTLKEVVPAAHRILLGAATSHISRASPDKGIRFAQRALDIAMAYELKEETRRSCNVCSALYVLTGAAADAIEYGLMAASLAKELSYSAAIVNSLANVNAALALIGLHAESIEIADHVFEKFAEQSECAMDVALVNTNAARAALALKRYDIAERNARRALKALDGNNAHDACYRLINEFTWMRCAIAQNDIATTNERMSEIEKIALAFPSPRNDLNRRYASALHLGFTQKAHLATIGQLGYLTAAAANFVPIYTDVLQQLCTMCSEANDHRSALFYAAELVDTVGQVRMGKVRELIAELGQKTERLMPQKSSVQSVLDGIIAMSIEPKPLPIRVDTFNTGALAKALEQLAATAELCDDPTRRAIYRVGKLSGLLATALGYSESQAAAIEHAARLHDIGKLGIPSAILAKPSARLNESEYLVMWRHASMGAQLLRQCNEPIFDLAAEIAHAHHEAWDGTGYPRNLQGEEIHEAARIVCLVETYDSMTHSRSYRNRMTHPEAIAYISKNAGQQFDPTMTTVFIRLVERLKALHGERMNDILAADSSVANERIADDSVFDQLNELVPNSVLNKLRGVLSPVDD